MHPFTLERPRDVAAALALGSAATPVTEYIAGGTDMVQLLQEYVQCSVKIAKLEAQVAEYLAFMERFRSSLRCEEHEPNQ